MAGKFGIYTIKAKTYSYNELGLDKSYSTYKFVLYYTVFHIFAIPVFPVDKEWKVKSISTNTQVPTDSNVRTKINLITLRRNPPFWSFALPIVLFLALVVFVG